MKHSIKESDLVIYALYLAVFKIYHIPEIVQQIYKIVLLIAVAFYVIRKSRPRQLLNNALPLCVSIILSGILSYFAGFIELKSVFDGVLHAICLYLICAVMSLCERNEIIRCLYRITSAYCIISLISIALNVNSGHKSEIEYFFGYKFMTSYYFIFWLILYRIKHEKRIRKTTRARIGYFLATLSVLLVCYWVDCATSMIAVLFLLGWQFMPETVREKLENRSWALILVVLAGALPFFMSIILQNSFVQNLVQNVFGRRMTLTGRMPIYLVLRDYLEQRPWFGYGYGNTVINQRFGYGNAQNGLLEHALFYGLVGTAILIWTLWTCMKKRGDGDAQTEGWYMIFYALVIASVVEISFNYIFYMTVFAPKNSQLSGEKTARCNQGTRNDVGKRRKIKWHMGIKRVS